MAYPPISTLPEPPSRSMSQNEFTTKADAFLAALPDFGDEQNTLADWMEGQAAITQGHVDTCTTKASEASASASAAALSATAAQSAANYAGIWSTLTGAALGGITVEHEEAIWMLKLDIPDVTASEPGVTTDWLLVTGAKYVIPMAGATLSTILINRFITSDTFFYPNANSVAEGVPITIAILEVNKGIAPRIDLVGGNDVTNGDQTVNDYVIYGTGFTGLEDVVSDGINTWEF